MNEMTSKSWQRLGSSVIWSPELLGPFVLADDAVPLRTALGWAKAGFPDSPPGNRSTVLVGGLQTVLETFERDSEAAFIWLRQYVKPLVRAFQSHWSNVGLVFAMDGPGKMFNFNEADELVYFGRARDRAEQIKLTFGMWNGAATGEGAFQLLDPKTNEVGGYHVNRLS